jgi:hypothetical protein
MYLMFARRPWAAQQQLVSRDRGLNQLRIWDHLAQIVLAAGFDELTGFYAMSAVLSYVLGYAVQGAANADSEIDRDAYLAAMGTFLAGLDEGEFPAVRRMAQTFARHDEQIQFEAGLDFLLDGLERRLLS